MVYDVTIDGKDYRLELERADASWRCRLDGREVQLDAVLARRDVLSILIGGTAYEIKRECTPTDMHLWVGRVRYVAELRDPRSLGSRKRAAADDQQMHRGRIAATGFAPDDLEQGVVARGEPGADEPAEDTIEDPLGRGRLLKLGRRKLSHNRYRLLNR